MSHRTTSGGCRSPPRAWSPDRSRRRPTAASSASSPACPTRRPWMAEFEPPGRHGHDRQRTCADDRFRHGHFGRRHLLEVHGLQQFPIRPGQRSRRSRSPRSCCSPAPSPGFGHRAGSASASRRDISGPSCFKSARSAGSSRASIRFRISRIAPEDMERLIEQLALVAPVHEHGVERPVEILAVLNADGFDRLQRLQSPGPVRSASRLHAGTRAKCMILGR